MKCKNCNNELKQLGWEIEDCVKYKFCIKLFGWKLMLLKDYIEYGCPECLIDEQKSREQDNFDKAVSDIISDEIEKGNLIPRE